MSVIQPVKKPTIAQLETWIRRFRNRRARWILKRDRYCLKLALEGKSDVAYQRERMFAWEIQHTTELLEKAIARLAEVKHDAQ